jgi:hypothetical protein
MQSHFKNFRPWYSKIVLSLLFPIFYGFVPPTMLEATCPGPQVSVTSQGTGAASFSWSAVSGATGYVVYYVRQDDHYTSSPIFTTSTSIMYSGLPSGRYNFCFGSVCGNEFSEIIIIEDLVI